VAWKGKLVSRCNKLCFCLFFAVFLRCGSVLLFVSSALGGVLGSFLLLSLDNDRISGRMMAGVWAGHAGEAAETRHRKLAPNQD
jgi:hypothetical protein